MKRIALYHDNCVNKQHAKTQNRTTAFFNYRFSLVR